MLAFSISIFFHWVQWSTIIFLRNVYLILPCLSCWCQYHSGTMKFYSCFEQNLIHLRHFLRCPHHLEFIKSFLKNRLRPLGLLKRLQLRLWFRVYRHFHLLSQCPLYFFHHYLLLPQLHHHFQFFPFLIHWPPVNYFSSFWDLYFSWHRVPYSILISSYFYRLAT